MQCNLSPPQCNLLNVCKAVTYFFPGRGAYKFANPSCASSNSTSFLVAPFLVESGVFCDVVDVPICVEAFVSIEEGLDLGTPPVLFFATGLRPCDGRKPEAI
jgi:hypothetical protein